ncbi:MAG: hypothetical protein ACRC1G_22465 [Bradyrhizobium sp.]|nr:hypothetical protein [Bradyrhizobium sp.]
MKSSAIALLLAISAIALPSVTTPASAGRMDGKCCMSSDGGRSYRHRMAIRRAAIPRTCSAYAASCARNPTERADHVRMCQAAKAQCMQTGVHVGPYSGRHFAGMQKI